MKIGPKYKIARRLGAPIFEKTQTQKFSVRAERKSKNKGFSGQKSEYGLQQAEKQKARMFYGVSEKQFSNYVKEVLLKKASKAVGSLYELLETRLDNTVARVGFASTKRAGRQMVSHGHILVNNKKVKIPSYHLKIGDKISIREGSKDSRLFVNLEENIKNISLPNWVNFDNKTKTVEIKSLPTIDGANLMFDLNAVIGFYSR